MKARVFILVITVGGILIGCNGDGGVTPQTPVPGYIWEVWTGFSESDPDRPPLVSIDRYSAEDGSESYPNKGSAHASNSESSYGYGVGYDAAYGDGRVWAAGVKIEVHGDIQHSTYGIWERGVDFFETERVEGLTYDGEYLWGSYGSDFYRIDPNTYECELMFTFGDGTKEFVGLAWDGEYLWGLAEGEAIKIDPETGSEVRSVTCPGGTNAGLTWGGKYLWVNDLDLNGSIYRFSPVDGTLLQVLDTGKSELFWAGGLAYEPEGDSAK
ncbi:MAG: hypothetical protein JSW52_07220 [Candidatus Coatesbacteria bacterium]|nr:MAG: hypothetical protein JSW52_07220 [Candidatus Coatesbacteria bacterium]